MDCFQLFSLILLNIYFFKHRDNILNKSSKYKNSIKKESLMSRYVWVLPIRRLFYLDRSLLLLCLLDCFWGLRSIARLYGPLLLSFTNLANLSRSPVSGLSAVHQILNLRGSQWSVIWSMSTISIMREQFVVTQSSSRDSHVSRHVSNEHTACQNVVSIKKWFVYIL
jgi:hypothetical protein